MLCSSQSLPPSMMSSRLLRTLGVPDMIFADLGFKEVLTVDPILVANVVMFFSGEN